MRTVLLIISILFTISTTSAMAADLHTGAVTGGVIVAPQPPRADNTARPAAAHQPLRMWCQPKTDVHGRPVVKDGRIIQECWAE